MEEIWKDIEGWKGLYQVSNMGRVRSLDRIVHRKVNGDKLCKGIVLKLRADKDGYMIAHLRNGSTSRMLKVHRLVGIAFIANLSNLPQIDHINGNRTDNRVENLRWCTCKENLNYPLARANNSTSTKESYNRLSNLRKIRANTFGKSGCIQITVKKDGELLGTFSSQREAADFLGFKACTLSAYTTGRLKPPLGYEFIKKHNQ